MEKWGSVGIHGDLQGSVGRGEGQAGAGKQLEAQPEQGIQDPLGLPRLTVTFYISLVVLGYLLPFFIHASSCDRLESIASKACLAERPAPLHTCRIAPDACGDLCRRTGGSTRSHPLLRAKDVFMSDAQHRVVPAADAWGSCAVPSAWKHIVPSGVWA